MEEFFSNPCTLGFIGGLVLSFYNFIEPARLPDNEKPSFNLIYWVTFLFWPALGLLFVHVYILSNVEVSGLIALQVGLTSPLILKGLISSASGISTEIKTPAEA